MGLAAHTYSRHKLPLLLNALEAFLAAAGCLPDFVSGVDYGLPLSLSSHLPSTPSQTALLPPPLKIRKPSAESTTTTFDPSHQNPPSYTTPKNTSMPPLPLRIVPRGTPTPLKKHIKPPSTGSVPTQARHSTGLNTHIATYNNAIHFLRGQIATSVTSVQGVIEEVEEMQHVRRVSKGMRRSGSFWSFSPVKGSLCGGEKEGVFAGGRGQLKEGKAERIARLRAEGWRTVGIRSDRRGWKGEGHYRGYCEAVLDELYFQKGRGE
ncbi:hypothetical protein BO71DRAFT_379999 [Aspergillus ellipticus CBS 707.79]|uniref:Uncharacterized protein n=1 Tax=Aspergillus ellipticus CBS 707.79 TaxID=1448320 RepID=A0A319DJE0_9EURO|nr:hypothetical protein BO71DRAFT_379999 [Aspergillus ellipticus CBS 707.79]